MVRGALRAFLPAAGVLLTAAVAIASGGGEAAHGSAAIPWGEIVKQAVNFAILVGVLVYFLRKPVASFLKERSELMRKSIDDAANARAEAARKLEAVDARMAKLSDEIAADEREDGRRKPRRRRRRCATPSPPRSRASGSRRSSPASRK